MLYIRNLRMRRLQAAFEGGEGFYERPRALARRMVDFVPGAQVPDEAREQSFGAPHGLEREVRDVVSDASNDAAHLVPQECGEINVSEDELDALDVAVEMCALAREYARAAPRLIPGERDEAAEERERDEEEDKMPHSD